METFYVTIHSITHAMRAQKLLQEQGIASYMQRDIQHTANQGCNYRLEIRGNRGKAMEILRKNHIRVLGEG